MNGGAVTQHVGLRIRTLFAVHVPLTRHHRLQHIAYGNAGRFSECVKLHSGTVAVIAIVQPVDGVHCDH